MIRRIFFFGLFALLMCIQSIHATHIVGGELRYRCLDNNTFELSLIIYRDCFYGDPNAWFDDPASIGIFDGSTDTLVTDLATNGQVLIPLMGNDTLDPSLNDPCLVVPPNVCVHTTTYRDTVNLPFREGGYTLAYQRCCRNQTLQNIIDPLASGATYLVRLTERALELGNSSPEFRDWPPIYICTDKPIDFDHSAIDSDGDSLVYKLCTPLLGANQANPRPQPPYNPPYDSVVWVDPPYNLNNLLGGVPLEINSSTGFMTGIPNNPGQYVVGVCVEEYRNDTLIGRLRRDFQYNVGVCGTTTSAFTAPDTTCVNRSIQLVNESESATRYRWIFGDIDQPDSISTEVEPVVQYNTSGSYDVTLIASNETGCSDTTSTEILVKSFLTDAQINYNTLFCTDTLEIQLSLQYTDTIQGDAISQYHWTVQYDGEEVISNEEQPLFSLSDVDRLFATLSIESEQGCMAQFKDTIELEFIPEFDIPDSLSICPKETVQLNPNAPADSFQYQWSPDDGSLNGVFLPNPTASPDTSTLYTVSISNSFGCQRQDSIWVEVLPGLDPFTITSSKSEVQEGESFDLSIPPDSSYKNVVWEPAQYLEPDSGFSVSGTIDETTVFIATAVDSLGCTTSDSITITLMQCPPADTIEGGLAKNTCLVGQGFDEQVMHVEGFIPVPEEYEACGFILSDVQGGYFNLKEYHINPINGFIKFDGWFHMTNDSIIQTNGNRIIANLTLCAPEGSACPVPVSIPIFMGTAGMCQMNGFMCHGFLLDWELPSPHHNGSGWQSFTYELYLPFINSLRPHSCHITTYEGEINIVFEDHAGPVLYDTFMVDSDSSGDHVIWEDALSLCEPDYQNAKQMIITYWNNCGDTCTNTLHFNRERAKATDTASEVNNPVKLMPNPAKNKISFNYSSGEDGFQLSILDARGKLYLKERRKGVNPLYSLDIHALQPGLYFLLIRESGKTTVRKFVKQ